MDAGPDDVAGPRTAGGIPLPPLHLRTGGAHFVEDDDFVALARRDAESLQELAGLDATSRVLDWGCGAGRLAVGLRATGAPYRSYLGVDVQPRFVEWCTRHLAADDMRFSLVDAPNARYNPDGTASPALPVRDGDVDVFYAYSVFSHVLADDAATYLGEVSRVLSPSGRAVITAFAEPGVRAWEENPRGYGPLVWDGPLHCVRYDEGYFADLALAKGLVVLELRRGRETDGQSLLVLGLAPPA